MTVTRLVLPDAEQFGDLYERQAHHSIHVFIHPGHTPDTRLLSLKPSGDASIANIILIRASILY